MNRREQHPSTIYSTAARMLETPEDEPRQLVVVANRLPVHYVETEGGWRTAPGGLVTALRPVVRHRDGVWVGWNDGARPLPRGDLRLRGVDLGPRLVRDYYEGYANRTLWPALHGMVDRIEDDPSWWEAYLQVNELFARAAADVAPPGATVWIQDYHLLLAPRLLSDLRPDVRVGLFLHTPVPEPVRWACVRQGRDLVAGMAGATLVGTQRRIDAEHLSELLDGSDTRVRAHPISIDVGHVRALAEDPLVQALSTRVGQRIGGGRRIVLGVDRLDYTKGIPERLLAYSRLLDSGEIDPRDTLFVQIASPSRTSVPAYEALRHRVRALAAAIDERHGGAGTPAVRLIEENVPFRQVVAHYLAADVAMVTPLRDGMNLVCKEFAVARSGDPVALVLSRTAGAADELRDDVVLVDPADVDDVARGLRTALRLTPRERSRRSRRLGAAVAAHDVHAWARDYLADLEGHADLEQNAVGAL